MRFKKVYHPDHLLGHYIRVESKPRGPYMTKRKREIRRNYQQIAIISFFMGFVCTLVYQGSKVHAMPSTVIQESVLEAQPVQNPVGVGQVAVEGLNEVEKEIKKVFGEHYDKAMILLKGKGSGTCAENRGLDQKAVNDNTVWGGVGKDHGVFQINDVYHPVKALNLDTDYKANIKYAWRMYVNDGHSFKRWTCGRQYGI